MGDTFYINVLVLLLVLAALVLRGGAARSFSRSDTLPLRGVLAMMVALTHIDASVYGGGDYARFFHFGAEAVAIFFFLSGYGTMKSLMNKGEVYRIGLIRRTAWKLGLPFVVAAGAWMPYYATTCPSWGRDLLHVITRGDLYCILPNSWFVFALFGCAIVFAIAFRRFPGGRGVLAVALLILGYYFVMYFAHKWGGWWYRRIWLFPLGVGFAWYERGICTLFRKNRIACALILLTVGALCLFLPMAPGMTRSTPVIGDLRYMMLGTYVGFLLLLTPTFFRCKFLDFLGSLSYEIYLIHALASIPLVRFGIRPAAMEIMAIIITPFAAWLLQRTVVKLNSWVKV